MPALAKPRYLPELDGVRAIAVLLVLWAHFPYVTGSKASETFWKIGHALRTGYVGVDLFFVLSGFLITRILLQECISSRSLSFRGFYARRALRIFPVYYLCVAIYALVFARHDGDLLSLATYTFNFYKPFHPDPVALEHTWSLSVEEQFYLVWPFIMATIPLGWGKTLTGIVIPAVSLLVALILAIGFDGASIADAIQMSSPTRMMSLSLGAFLAFLEADRTGLSGLRSSACIGAGLLTLACDYLAREFQLIPPGGLYWCGALVGYALFSFGSIALVLNSDNRIIERVKILLRFRPLRYVGRISYGLYLYHYLILFLFGLAPHQTAATGAGFAPTVGALLLTFAVAAFSFKFLEAPLLRLKDRLGQKEAGNAMTANSTATA